MPTPGENAQVPAAPGHTPTPGGSAAGRERPRRTGGETIDFSCNEFLLTARRMKASFSGPPRQTSANPSQIPIICLYDPFSKRANINDSCFFDNCLSTAHPVRPGGIAGCHRHLFACPLRLRGHIDLLFLGGSAAGQHAHSYGVGKLILCSCDKFYVDIRGFASLDIWPDGHSICKAPLRSPCSICAASRHVVDRQHQ